MPRLKNLEIKKKVYETLEILPVSVNTMHKKVKHSYNSVYRYLLILVQEKKIKTAEISGITVFYMTPELIEKRNLYK